MSYLQLHIEAIIFTALAPVKISDIKAALEKTFQPVEEKKEVKVSESEASQLEDKQAEASENKANPVVETEEPSAKNEESQDVESKKPSAKNKEQQDTANEASATTEISDENVKSEANLNENNGNTNKEVEAEKAAEKQEKEISEDITSEETETEKPEKEISEEKEAIAVVNNSSPAVVKEKPKKKKPKKEKPKKENEIPEAQIIEVLKDIKEKYTSEDYAWELRKSGGGYQFLTKPPYFNTIANLLNLKTKRKLTRSAMETLAIIAYKQPATKAELEHIRGVSCDYALQKLLDKELVIVSGRADGPGKPLLYSTSTTFMDYFGINSPEDMPTLKEFQSADQEIGEPQE